jgi:ABC-type sugar transport systems, permease components
VGIASVPWLTDPEIALWALVIMGVWKIIGYNLVLFLVGLRNIPASYLEAASLDGATAWQRFRYVTLPLLKPILLYVLVTSTINAYNVFTQVYVMTLGSQAHRGRPCACWYSTSTRTASSISAWATPRPRRWRSP